MLIVRKLTSEIEKYINAKEAIVLTGMRRTGKTSLMSQIFEKITSKNKLSLDLENPLNQHYFEETNFEKIKRMLEFLGLKFNERAYLFLDEIQLVKNLPQVLKYLIDHYNLKCFLTGSSSFYLKNLFTESMAGRKYVFELFPLDFEEFLLFKNSKLQLPQFPQKIDRNLFDTLEPLYDEYLCYGGFPEIALKETVEEKKKSLEEIFTSYFQLEVLRFGDYRKNDAIRDLMLLLMQRAGSKIDMTKLASELGINRLTLGEYLSFLEGTYFINLVRPFSRNPDTEVRKTPKVYLCDSGILNHHAKVNDGTLFENNVFQNLKMRGKVNYYQRKTGAEIDFILNEKIAVEVKTFATKSDLTELENLSQKIKLNDVRIVSKKYSEEIADSGKLQFGFNV